MLPNTLLGVRLTPLFSSSFSKRLILAYNNHNIFFKLGAGLGVLSSYTSKNSGQSKLTSFSIIALAIGAYDTVKGYVLNSWGFLTPLITSWQTLAPWYTNLNFVFLLLVAARLASNIIIAAVLTRRKPKEEKSEPKKERSKEKNA